MTLRELINQVTDNDSESPVLDYNLLIDITIDKKHIITISKFNPVLHEEVELIELKVSK